MYQEEQAILGLVSRARAEHLVQDYNYKGNVRMAGLELPSKLPRISCLLGASVLREKKKRTVFFLPDDMHRVLGQSFFCFRSSGAIINKSNKGGKN